MADAAGVRPSLRDHFGSRRFERRPRKQHDRNTFLTTRFGTDILECGIGVHTQTHVEYARATLRQYGKHNSTGHFTSISEYPISFL